MTPEEIKEHEFIRDTFTWGSHGKDGDKPFDKINTLSNLSDSHLLHIIGHVHNHTARYTVGTADALLNEARYRDIKKIFVADYPRACQLEKNISED